MPLSNLFKNCGYYWTAAFVVAWDIQRMVKLGAAVTPATYAFVGLFALFECLNGYCHLHLAYLRTDRAREAAGVSSSETVGVRDQWGVVGWFTEKQEKSSE